MNSPDFSSDTLADLERARAIACELEAQVDALVEFIRPIAGQGCRYYPRRCKPGPGECQPCHASRLLAACDGIPE